MCQEKIANAPKYRVFTCYLRELYLKYVPKKVTIYSSNGCSQFDCCGFTNALYAVAIGDDDLMDQTWVRECYQLWRQL